MPSSSSSALRVPRAWRPTLSDAGDAGQALLATAAGLAIGIAVVDGAHAAHPVAILLAALVVAAGDLVVRAPLRLLARSSGAVGALVIGLGAQLLIAWAALTYVPGIVVSSTMDVVKVLLIAAVVMAVGRWVWGVNDTEYVLGDVLRRARAQARRAGVAARDDGSEAGAARLPGLLVVQLDGVSQPVLTQAVEAGLAPTVARWIGTGTHQLVPWWSQVPATTPAAQAGLLHGDTDQVPAFRWWDRELGRVVVTNHPHDAALVESRISTGKGLLAPDGVAVATMFSGDAATSLLVMSRSTRLADGTRRRLGSGAPYLRFFASPFVFTRAVLTSVGEMVKELYQARRQRVRGVWPRVSRGGWYVVLRGISNAFLRDLTTSLVAEHLVRGTPVIFVDLVDYDEIAHHAGPTRPESLRALEGLDGVLGVLEQVLPVAGREYRLVVLSDHGQSMGETFEQGEGQSLLGVVQDLMGETGLSGLQSAEGEDWGPLNSLLTATFSDPGRAAVVLGPDAPRRDRPADVDLPDVVVLSSGNLALVSFPRFARRPTLEELQQRWPALVVGLAARAGIGVVVVDTAERGLVAIGAGGLVLLEQDGSPEGEDPLAGWGPRARGDLARAGRLAHTGDLLVVSSTSPSGHVRAFEGLVGSHGGLGGAQNRAFLLHPADLEIDDELLEGVGAERMLVGAAQVHEQLVRWSSTLGLRP